MHNYFFLRLLLRIFRLNTISEYGTKRTLEKKMAPSGSPALPGRQPYCANRQSR